MEQERVYEFGSYILDPHEHLLRQGSTIVPLTPKVVDTLLILVERHGQLVTKETLVSSIWPDTVVEEGNLTQNISVLRRTLREDGIENSIETVPKRGYRFVADVREVTKGAGKSSLPADAPRCLDKRRIGVIAAGLATLGAVLATVPVTRWSRAYHNPEVRQLTADQGVELYPVSSPDGTRLIYTWDQGKPGNVDLYVRGMDAPISTSPKRITHDEASECYPAWSPDGEWIAFLHCASGLGRRALPVYVMSHAGGQKRLVASIEVIDYLDYPLLAWSADSRFLIAADATGLVRLPVSGGEKHLLTHLPAGFRGDSSPALSRDGRTLAFVRAKTYAGSDLYLLPMEPDGSSREEPRRVLEGQALITNPMWRQSGRELLYTLHQGGRLQLWRAAPFRQDVPQPVTVPGSIGMHLGLTKTGDRLLFADYRGDTDIWRVPMGSKGPAQTVRLISSTRNDANPQISPDGTRIAFASERSGNQEVWISDSDGRNPFQLTTSANPSGTPRWSPDGGQIAFDATRGGNADVYVVDASGGPPRQITDDPGPDNVPSWSRDGRWIYFNSRRAGGHYNIWKTSTSGGSPIRVTEQGGFNGLESFDGRFLYYARDEKPSPSVWRRSTQGGKEDLVLPAVRSWVHFTLSDTGLYFVPEQESPGGVQVQFWDFRTRQVRVVAAPGFGSHGFGLAVSPKADWLLMAPTELGRSDLLMVENLR